MKQQKLKIEFQSAIVILLSYLIRKAKLQLGTIFPMLFLMGIFQFFIIQYPLKESLTTIFYLLLLIPAMIFMLEGVKLGLMPVVEEVSASLVKQNKKMAFIGSIFIFGISIVLIEHYKEAQNIFSNSYLILLALTISLLTIYGMLRFLFSMSFRKIIQRLFITILLLSIAIEFVVDDVHLAFSLDSVNMVINPIVYGMILSFGYGVTRVTLSGIHINRAGFGTITLISLSALIFTQLYVIIFSTLASMHDISPLINVNTTLDFIYNIELNMVMTVIYIVYILLLQFTVIKKPLLHPRDMVIGLVFVVIGTFLFFIGLKYGLAVLAKDMFFFLPSLIRQIDIIGSDITIGYGPLYSVEFGRFLIVVFLFLLGYSATIAEPGLSIIANHTANVSIGSFKKNLFKHAVAVGVGIGSAVGAFKFIYDLNYFALIILPLIVIIAVLTQIDKRFLSISMDYATVAVGPISIIMIASLMKGFNVQMDTHSTFLLQLSPKSSQ
jgi:hypothetical protein